MRAFQALPHPGSVSKYGSKRVGFCEFFWAKEKSVAGNPKKISEARPVRCFRPPPERARPIFGHTLSESRGVKNCVMFSFCRVAIQRWLKGF